MDYVIITLAIAFFLLVLFVLKSAKKHFLIKAIKLVFYLGVILLALIILSGYFDLGGFFSKDSSLVQTGAAVTDAIADSLS